MKLNCPLHCHLRNKFAAPACVSYATHRLLNVLGIGLIAYNLGPEHYVTYAMVHVFLHLSGCLLGGIWKAEDVLITQAVGLEQYFYAGQYVQLSVSWTFNGAVDGC